MSLLVCWSLSKSWSPLSYREWNTLESQAKRPRRNFIPEPPSGLFRIARWMNGLQLISGCSQNFFWKDMQSSPFVHFEKDNHDWSLITNISTVPPSHPWPLPNLSGLGNLLRCVRSAVHLPFSFLSLLSYHSAIFFCLVYILNMTGNFMRVELVSYATCGPNGEAST